MKRKIFAVKLRDIKRNVSSNASTVQLVKTKVITHLLTWAIDFSGRNFPVTQRKSFENYIELKHCKTSSSCRVFYLLKLKPEKERYYLILEYDYVT